MIGKAINQFRGEGRMFVQLDQEVGRDSHNLPTRTRFLSDILNENMKQKISSVTYYNKLLQDEVSQYPQSW